MFTGARDRLSRKYIPAWQTAPLSGYRAIADNTAPTCAISGALFSSAPATFTRNPTPASTAYQFCQHTEPHPRRLPSPTPRWPTRPTRSPSLPALTNPHAPQ